MPVRLDEFPGGDLVIFNVKANRYRMEALIMHKADAPDRNPS
ncbi:MAG TPA: hypothetical protein VN878_06695 [Usitatibacter sp.]|nr:hypothetical protein [Usitatibacter sp.]